MFASIHPARTALLRHRFLLPLALLSGLLITGIGRTEPLFLDVTVQAGLVDAGAERGIAWGDFDNDGDQDLYVAILGGPDRLFRNQGDKTFVDVTAAAGLADFSMSAAPAWCDYDADGDLDLFVGRADADVLYRNEGDGTFTNVTDEAGVTGATPSWGVALGDYDGNGTLDLYVVDSTDAPNRLLVNHGDGTFSDMAENAGVATGGQSLGASGADFDEDGDLDLYVTTKVGANRFYRNDGAGVFTDIADTAAVQDTGECVGVNWGDFDNDGDRDLFLTANNSANRLFLNQGNGRFVSAAEAAGLAWLDINRAAAWADIDQDGDLDLYLACSYLANTSGANHLYRNDGHAVFTDITKDSGTSDDGSGTSVAWADYDNDGDLDLFLSNFGGTMRLFENRQVSAGHWLGIRLISAGPNTHAIGASVRVYADDRIWLRENIPSTGYQSQAPQQLHFGLGSVAEVDSIAVRWPDGEIEQFGPCSADQYLALTQH